MGSKGLGQLFLWQVTIEDRQYLEIFSVCYRQGHRGRWADHKDHGLERATHWPMALFNLAKKLYNYFHTSCKYNHYSTYRLERRPPRSRALSASLMTRSTRSASRSPRSRSRRSSSRSTSRRARSSRRRWRSGERSWPRVRGPGTGWGTCTASRWRRWRNKLNWWVGILVKFEYKYKNCAV